jgi:hypothetical protein
MFSPAISDLPPIMPLMFHFYPRLEQWAHLQPNSKGLHLTQPKIKNKKIHKNQGYYSTGYSVNQS